MNIRNIGHWCWDKVFYMSNYFSMFFVIALTIIDISNLNEKKTPLFGAENFEIGKIIYYLCVCFALIFGFVSIFNQQEVSELDRSAKIKDAKISDLESSLNQVVDETNQLFNSYLKLLVKSLNFGSDERISVYKIYNNEFIRIGRTSENPNFKNTGRKSYPISEGFIGRGWSAGECFVDNLPDPAHRNGDTYYNAVKNVANISRDVVDTIHMKSRTYCICRINGFDGEPKAVFVAESTREHAFSKEDVMTKIEDVKQPLVMFIEKINNASLNSQQILENIGL